jgi:hypothetical protein
MGSQHEYKLMLETFLRIELHPRQKICCGYDKIKQLLTQQKFSCQSSGKCFLADTFLAKDNTWPAPSPDLAVSDYYLWGYVKSKVRVYETRPANIADLKQRILECI